jgi:hypothetical protein
MFLYMQDNIRYSGVVNMFILCLFVVFLTVSRFIHILMYKEAFLPVKAFRCKSGLL